MPYKQWQFLEKLASADVNSYLMNQSIMSFTDVATGTASLGTSLSAGMAFYDQTNKQLAMYDGTVFRGLPYAVQAGTASITVTAAAYGSATINFTAGRFTQAPVVFTNINGIPSGSSKFSSRAASSGTASFVCYLYTGDGTTATSTVPIYWMAVQMTSGTAVG